MKDFNFSLGGRPGANLKALGLLCSGALLILSLWSCGPASRQAGGPADQQASEPASQKAGEPARQQAEQPPCAAQPASIATPHGEAKRFGLVVPADSNAWVISITTSGGYTGHGVGNIHITSRGEASVSRVHPPPVASAGNLSPLDAAVRKSTPDSWRACYLRDDATKEGPSDQVSYALILAIRRDGQEYWFNTSWQTGSLLPQDLRNIYQTAWSIRRPSAAVAR
jgi:hypothetical protein